MAANFNAALFIGLTLLLPFQLFALEEEALPNFAKTVLEGDDSTVYIIRHINIEVDGITQPFMLRFRTEMKEGDLVKGKQALERYLTQKHQAVYNQRILEDSVGFEFSLGDADEEGRIPVDIAIQVTDSWHIFVLPYPKYDTNDGLSVTIKGRDYNFLGLMTPLRLDLGYELDSEYVDGAILHNLGKGSISFGLSVDIPFQAYGLDWNMSFNNEVNYTNEYPLAFMNATGLSVQVPFYKTTFTVGFEQRVVVNEENWDGDKAYYGDYFDGVYMATTPFVYWSIPVGIEVGNFGELKYTPGLSSTIKYQPNGNKGLQMIDEPRDAAIAIVSHSLGFGRIDWVENFRKGLDASIGNENAYNFDSATWGHAAQFTITGHLPLSTFFGISGRVQFRQWFKNTHESATNEAGDVLRGIVNKSIGAQYMLSSNLDLPLRLFRFVPSKWFDSQKLHLFDFDFHISPIVDLALVKGNRRGAAIDFAREQFIAAGGGEVIVFPHIMRSLFLRISVAFDLRALYENRKLPDGDGREVFIGMGHHY
ncbi:hypothetical protein ACYULU_08015 [Breznakiellaceae bacterium SP9]